MTKSPSRWPRPSGPPAWLQTLEMAPNSPSRWVSASLRAPTATSCTSLRESSSLAPTSTRLSAVTAHDQLEAGPHLGHGADLDVHEAERQRERADRVLGDVRGDARGFLRPGDPDGRLRVQLAAVGGERLRELFLPLREVVDDVGAAARARRDPGAVGQRRQEPAVFLRRVDGPHHHAGPDAELGGERRARVAGHLPWPRYRNATAEPRIRVQTVSN